MKKISAYFKKDFLIVMVILFGFGGVLNAQDLTGSWEGNLEIQGTTLSLVFNLNEVDGVLKGTMDSPDQNAYDLPLSEVLVKNDSVSLKLQMAGISYIGKLEASEINGVFKQGNFEVPMTLKKSTSEVKKANRPQEPKPPFNYKVEDVSFQNHSADIKLSGTLTSPKGAGPFPAVVLISGSGAQDRDETVFGHKPFYVLADYLTKKGIAVLRFDDRGVGASEGNHAVATSEDFATDVSAAVDFLKTKNHIAQSKIGLIGHSEGGIIAPLVHTQRSDIAFMVLLAGTGVRGDILLLEQQRLIGTASGMTQDQLDEAENVNTDLFKIAAEKNTSTEEISKKMQSYLEESLKENPAFISASESDKETYISGIIERITSPWMLYFLNYDPSLALQKTTCAVLALNGDKDLQVPAKMNLGAIEKALKTAGNTQYEIVEFHRLNHLFQTSETGAPSEYGKIEETIAPNVLKTIEKWILKTVN